MVIYNDRELEIKAMCALTRREVGKLILLGRHGNADKVSRLRFHVKGSEQHVENECATAYICVIHGQRES